MNRYRRLLSVLIALCLCAAPPVSALAERFVLFSEPVEVPMANAIVAFMVRDPDDPDGEDGGYVQYGALLYKDLGDGLEASDYPSSVPDVAGYEFIGWDDPIKNTDSSMWEVYAEYKPVDRVIVRISYVYDTVGSGLDEGLHGLQAAPPFIRTIMVGGSLKLSGEDAISVPQIADYTITGDGAAEFTLNADPPAVEIDIQNADIAGYEYTVYYQPVKSGTTINIGYRLIEERPKNAHSRAINIDMEEYEIDMFSVAFTEHPDMPISGISSRILSGSGDARLTGYSLDYQDEKSFWEEYADLTFDQMAAQQGGDEPAVWLTFSRNTYPVSFETRASNITLHFGPVDFGGDREEYFATDYVTYLPAGISLIDFNAQLKLSHDDFKEKYSSLGYDFVGWSTDPSATEPDSYDSFDTAMPSKPLTFYAVFKKDSYYTVTIDFGEASDLDIYLEDFTFGINLGHNGSVYLLRGASLGSLLTTSSIYGNNVFYEGNDTLARYGSMIFTGWRNSLTGEMLKEGDTLVGNATLTAEWEPNPDTYELFINFNGVDARAEVDLDGQNLHCSSPVTAVRVQKDAYLYSFVGGNTAYAKGDDADRYVFDYWSTDAEGIEQFEYGTPLSDGMTLFAQWKELCVLTIDCQGASVQTDYDIIFTNGITINSVNGSLSVKVPKGEPLGYFYNSTWYMAGGRTEVYSGSDFKIEGENRTLGQEDKIEGDMTLTAPDAAAARFGIDIMLQTQTESDAYVLFKTLRALDYSALYGKINASALEAAKELLFYGSGADNAQLGDYLTMILNEYFWIGALDHQYSYDHMQPNVDEVTIDADGSTTFAVYFNLEPVTAKFHKLNCAQSHQPDEHNASCYDDGSANTVTALLGADIRGDYKALASSNAELDENTAWWVPNLDYNRRLIRSVTHMPAATEYRNWYLYGSEIDFYQYDAIGEENEVTIHVYKQELDPQTGNPADHDSLLDTITVKAPESGIVLDGLDFLQMAGPGYEISDASGATYEKPSDSYRGGQIIIEPPYDEVSIYLGLRPYTLQIWTMDPNRIEVASYGIISGYAKLLEQYTVYQGQSLAELAPKEVPQHNKTISEDMRFMGWHRIAGFYDDENVIKNLYGGVEEHVFGDQYNFSATFAAPAYGDRGDTVRVAAKFEWEQDMNRQAYFITFVDEIVIPPQMLAQGQQYINDPDPDGTIMRRDGYIFDGWYYVGGNTPVPMLRSSLSGSKSLENERMYWRSVWSNRFDFDTYVNVNSSMVFYAKWIPIEREYTVHYMKEGEDYQIDEPLAPSVSGTGVKDEYVRVTAEDLRGEGYYPTRPYEAFYLSDDKYAGTDNHHVVFFYKPITDDTAVYNVIVHLEDPVTYTYSVDDNEGYMDAGTIGSLVDLEAEGKIPEINGYELYPLVSRARGVIAADGSLELHLYYRLWRYDYTVRCVDADTESEIIPDRGWKRINFRDGARTSVRAPDISEYAYAYYEVYDVHDEITKELTDSSDGLTVNLTMTKYDKEVIFYYREAPSYAVTYHANGGNGGYLDADIESGAKYTVLSQAETGINRAGYTFSSWNTAANGSGTGHMPGAEIEITGDITLYAQWLSNPPTDPTPTPSLSPTPSPSPTPTPSPSPMPTPSPSPNPSPTPRPTSTSTAAPTATPAAPTPIPGIDPQDPYIVVPVKPALPPILLGEGEYVIGEYHMPLNGIGGRNVGDCPN